MRLPKWVRIILGICSIIMFILAFTIEIKFENTSSITLLIGAISTQISLMGSVSEVKATTKGFYTILTCQIIFALLIFSLVLSFLYIGIQIPRYYCISIAFGLHFALVDLQVTDYWNVLQRKLQKQSNSKNTPNKNTTKTN